MPSATPAGLLDYFFRGELEVEVTDGQVEIFNRSEEIIEDGRFELYYDTQDGERTVLGDAYVESPLSPGDSQVVSFTMPSGVYNCNTKTKLMVVCRGKLGTEHDAVVGKIVNISPDCVVIKAGNNGGTHFFTVWDPATNKVAEIFDPETGVPISFPAEFAEIGNWLSERSTTVTTPAYLWEMENNVLKRIGESWQDEDRCSCTVDTDIETSCRDYQELTPFTHPGCGVYTSYCDYSQTLTTQDGKDIWDTVEEGFVFVDRDFQWSILGSYAPLVNTMTGNGGAAV